MFIVVNSITIKIHSKAFHASFELWQLQGYSVNPNWQQSDLRLTRITDPQRGEVKSPRMSPIITCPERWHSGLSRCSGLLGRCLNSPNWHQGASVNFPGSAAAEVLRADLGSELSLSSCNL